MTQNTPRLDLPRIQPAQAQKHVTHNSAIELLDAITQLNVLAREAETPPSSPSEGDCYALGAAPTGDWVGQAGALAIRSNGGWMFVAPRDGWRLWDAGTGTLCVYTNGAWTPATGGLQNINGIGINTTSDATNRLAIAADATLLTNEGGAGGHQLKINKALDTDTASLLFQTGYSGRAEMGTTGSDDFAVKVSADGTTFTTALSFNASNGIASGDAIQQSADDVTPGRLMRADYGYGPGNLVGSVSEVAGVPTGAVVESARTSTGDYVRFADGTQICSDALSLSHVGDNRLEALWVFPVAFHGSPQAITGSVNGNSFLSNATPSLEEIGGVVHSNATSSQTKLLVYRISGMTNFASGDSSSCRVTAVGRWY